MTLSTSRQQFLPYETQHTENIQYTRRGGVFVSTCICICFVILAFVFAAVVGAIVYFVTHFKLLQKADPDFWDETEPFGQNTLNSQHLRLTSDIVPSFYRLKKKIDLDNSNFSGTVYITIKANKNTNKITLHSKNLHINENIKLTEQIYEKLETLHPPRSKREDNNASVVVNTTAESVPVNDVNLTTDSTKETNSITTEVNLVLNEEPIKVVEVHDSQVTHSSARNIQVTSVTKEVLGDYLVLSLGSDLKPDIDYILEISFNGTITESLTGLYKSAYLDSDKNTKWMGVTQFEPTSARAAFPCFDQPEFKAKFEISIAHHKNLTVLSNMGVSSEEEITEESNWKWTHFERSVNMSTYLVAYVLSEFKSLNTSYKSMDNATKSIKIWAQPNLLHKAKYALSITPRLLEFYEEVFGVPYNLDKIDLIAVPDFSSGAMENWGLMTFRETTLLFDEKEHVPHDKQNVAVDVAHELAHQWFGNMVTMKWWNDLWLNEGFATYIEYVGVNHVEPELNMLNSFSRDKMDLLRSDALKNTSPVSRDVIDASEITQKFDEISYAKSASLIRMLNHTITYEHFHKGLASYLKKWMFSNAEENDLWESMSEATKSDPILKDISIVKFMNTWTRQAGYPVVNIKRDYKSGNVTFEQRLFSAATDPYPKMMNQLWQIPISYTNVDSNLDQWITKPKLWLNAKSTTVHLPSLPSEALYINVDAIGYYRVNYDEQNWALLGKALKSGQFKSPLAKAQLIDDAFNLAKAGQLEYSSALDLTTYVIRGEDSNIVWDLLLNNMAFLKYNLRKLPFYVHFQDFMRMLLAKQLKTLNYGLNKPKNDYEAFLIENLVMWECYMENSRCLQWAKEQFTNWTSQSDHDNNPIPSYLRPLVYAMALKHGGRTEFDFLWNIYETTTDPNVKSIIINNLPSTRNEELIAWLLEKSLSDIPNQYAPAVWNVDSPLGFKIAQDFLIKNWDRIYSKFSQMDSFMFPAVLNGAFGFITNKDELNKLKTFALKHKEELRPLSQTLQKLVDTANIRINWLEKHSPSIELWLKQFLSESLTTTTSAIEEPITEAGTSTNINTTTVKHRPLKKLWP